MSEKRFKLIQPLGTRLGLTDIFIKDTQKDYYYNTKEMVIDLLNRLSEENEQLKKEHKIAIDEMITDYKNLEKENEQLRNFIELMNMRQKWKLYNYKRDNDE